MKDTAAHYIQVLIDQPRLTCSSRGRALVAFLERRLTSNQTFATIYGGTASLWQVTLHASMMAFAICEMGRDFALANFTGRGRI